MNVFVDVFVNVNVDIQFQMNLIRRLDELRLSNLKYCIKDVSLSIFLWVNTPSWISFLEPKFILHGRYREFSHNHTPIKIISHYTITTQYALLQPLPHLPDLLPSRLLRPHPLHPSHPPNPRLEPPPRPRRR